ncbi:MAG: LutC/YkgG family protein [Symbiobacteriia bacterium]
MTRKAALPIEQAMLTRIAHRLGHRASVAGIQARVPWDPAESLPDRPPAMPQAELVRRFLAELERLGGHGLLARTAQEAVDYVAAVATGRPAGPVLLSDDPRLAGLRLPEVLAAQGCEVTVWNAALAPATAKQLAANARVGITGADWAVAETGSIVLTASPGRGRLVSLLPPIHVALLRQDRVLPSVAELFRTLAGEARSAATPGAPPLPSSLALATGPSRSADIENDLTIGVHGPAEVHVVLLPAAEAGQA